MTDPAQLVFNPADPRIPVFAPSSRYFGLAILTWEDADGAVHAYVARRFVPPPEELASAGEYAVADGERADLVAAKVFGDPELFWRLCDGNRALRAEEVERTGRRLRVTLPVGMPAGRGE
jgi:hypothetical protein